MPDEPTLGEVMRRLDTLVTTITDLATQMREDRNHAATTFVRQDVWREARRADQGDVKEVDSRVEGLAADRQRNENFRKQASLAFALASLTILTSVGLSIFGLLSGGGA